MVDTEEDSMKVYCLSITLLIAFEWNDKSLKYLPVTGSKIASQGIAARTGEWKRQNPNAHVVVHFKVRSTI